MGSLDNILYWQLSLTFQVIIMCMHIISFLVPLALLVFVHDCAVFGHHALILSGQRMWCFWCRLVFIFVRNIKEYLK